MKTAGQLLRERKDELSVSDELLAQRSGISRPTLHNYLNDKSDIPLKHFIRLAGILLLDARKIISELYVENLRRPHEN